jgi:hypothetical protein
MTIAFVIDRLGYPATRAEWPWIAVASMLESELQGDFAINGYLEKLHGSWRDGSRVELSGNAHTIVAEGGMAETVCDLSPDIPPSQLSTRDLIDLITAWQGYLARGTPKHWPTEDGGRATVLNTPP